VLIPCNRINLLLQGILFFAFNVCRLHYSFIVFVHQRANCMDRLDVSLPIQPEGFRYRFHAMIKPIGAQCNLNCSYCSYLSKRELLNQPAAPRMSFTLLASHIRQYIEVQTDDEVVISWQGGEPTYLAERGWSSSTMAMSTPVITSSLPRTKSAISKIRIGEK